MFDFCINGGGMVGSALALGLAQQGYHIAVIEPVTPMAFSAEQGPDLRVSAISHASVTLLKALGAWSAIERMRLKPYTALSVWETADVTTFSADMANIDTLGYFVENRLLQLGCMQALKGFENVTWLSDKTIRHIAQNEDGASLTLDNDECLDCRYLIGADGAASQVRSAANIGTSGWQYGQQAMGIVIELEQDSGSETWQQFTPDGPRAFLPMYGNMASLIWYDSPQVLNRIKGLSDSELKAQIRDHFPAKLNEQAAEFTIRGKAAFPLSRSHASAYVAAPYILIGDAAHTINPLAGQGVNLGFKDVETLLAVTADKPDLNIPDFASQLRQRYEIPRRRENLQMMTAMDGFYLLFSNNIGPIKWIRNQLLSATEHFELGKRSVLKYALGMNEWKF
ncbi:FAD-dependent monooxygenase [Alteromonas halophila]|uniref:2-octaprenyl-3-methyl-6-methoxy-1,4-benzoquinol hydroxylase n=1 Tax=Alteromonas halophila TaxID=516698 RepID=A0A918JF50_9ALTE|nr:FAD-dependent monooxygenase [Alteromonas halophila]GGW75870.1 2-octaprenyl-3-methyl-6-methoxy-1,4-benzoquinol hydroxylase [Alteromonas halophila]